MMRKIKLLFDLLKFLERAGIKIMGGKGDDEAVVVDENISHSWDEEEWHWQ